MCVGDGGDPSNSEAQRIGRGQTTTSNVKLSANRSIAAQRIIVFIEKWSGIRISHQLRTFSGTLQTLQLRSVGAFVLGKAIYNIVFYERSAKTHVWGTHYSPVRRNVLLQLHIHFGGAQWCAGSICHEYLMLDFLVFDFYLHLPENPTEKKISLLISSVWAHDTSFVIRSFVCVQKLPPAFCQQFVSIYSSEILHHSQFAPVWWTWPCALELVHDRTENSLDTGSEQVIQIVVH